MRDLLAADGRDELEVLRRPGTLVVLDYDGTIAPLVRDRTRARMTARTTRIVAALAARRPLAVLSGRGLADLAERMAPARVRWLVGGHGAEWPGERAPAALVRRVDGWRRALESALEGVDGIDLEDKRRSLSVHWRAARDPARAEAAVAKAAARLRGAACIRGKRVLNVVPAGAPDKGDALARLVAESGCGRVLFVGDDVTDEAAFRRRLPVPAVMVRVGRSRESAAPWFVKDRPAVDRLLETLLGPAGAEGDPAGRLGPTLDFMRTLWALEHGLNRRSKAMNQRLGVTGPQRLVIRVVEALGPIAPGALARVLHLHPASVTRLALTLERRRILHRFPDPHDRRRLLLERGPAATRVQRETSGTVEAAVRAALARSSPDEVASARRLLERIADALRDR